MATRKTKAVVAEREAAELAGAIHAQGDFAHVSVRAERGHLNVYPGDEDAVARLTPLGGGQYGLSFHSHTGEWERMPFMGDIPQMADILVTTLAPYLERWDFPRRMSGSED